MTEDDIIKAAVHYANNLEDVKPTNGFNRNLCIALGQAFRDGAKWSYEQAIAELQEKTAQVKKNGTWDGVDVDKHLIEIREGVSIVIDYKPLLVMCYDVISEYRNGSLGDGTIRELERLLKDYPIPN